MNSKSTKIALVWPSIVGLASFAPASAEALTEITASTPNFCRAISKDLTRRAGSQLPLYVKSIDGEGRKMTYENVDIDGDKKPDVLDQDCGSSSLQTCELVVSLSKGGGYALELPPFSVIRYRFKYYALVGDSYPIRRKDRQLYALTSHGARINCKNF